MAIDTSLLSAALGLPAAERARWAYVRERFRLFHSNVQLTTAQRADGLTKANGVLRCLDRHYYGERAGDIPNGFFIGSWGKGTATRPPRDVDLYFVLPPEVFTRLEAYLWNRQSALLQEVKGVLEATYPNTRMSGDGQIVLVGFDRYSVEVVPAFLMNNGDYWICDTRNGGSYRTSKPWAEIERVDTLDKENNGNLRPLIQMLKAWQVTCNVPIKSFQLDLLASDFLRQSPWRLNSFFYYDWLVRDFFAYLHAQANTVICMPGTFELIYLGDAWQSRARSAYERAVKACEYEHQSYQVHAGEEWQKIFGSDIPAYFDG